VDAGARGRGSGAAARRRGEGTAQQRVRVRGHMGAEHGRVDAAAADGAAEMEAAPEGLVDAEGTQVRVIRHRSRRAGLACQRGEGGR
jgi:hypothetical protein